MKEYKGYLVDDDLKIYNSKTGRQLSPFVGTDGYAQVARHDNNHVYHERVHVILAHCFIENPNGYKYINHIDSNKLNNSLENLEWCTNSQNVAHGWRSGNRTHKNHTAVSVSSIDGEPIGIYTSIRRCAADLHLDRHKVARVLKGELSKEYLGYLFNYVESQTTIEMVSAG